MNKEYEQKIWGETLGKDETISYSFTIGRRLRKVGTIVWAIVLLPVLVGGIITMSVSFLFSLLFLVIYLYPIFLYQIYMPRANLYALTNKRIVVRRGWLSHTTQSIDYRNITDMSVQESFLNKKLFRVGNILVNTAGHLTDQIVLKNIEHPLEVKKRIDSLK